MRFKGVKVLADIAGDNILSEMLTDTHKQIVDIIGLDAFVSLCENYGGANLYIPKIDSIRRISRDIGIKSDYKNGMTLRQMREKYNLTEVHIRRILEDEELPGQMNLFE